MLGSPVEDIKARVDLVDFIREYVPLKRMGSNWKGVCPFHTEKTPSFMVSSEKGIWKCFGCSAGGDIFTFLMKRENMEFPEALRTLAQRAGVVLRAQDPKFQNHRSRLLELMNAAADFFQLQLKESAAAEHARQYLTVERKLASATIDGFRVGFAPHSWNDLSRHLLDRGFTENEILASGVVVPSDQPRKDQRMLPFYDRFRGRITFPITDAHGNVIGFGARVFAQESDEPKYINTPATALYDKGAVLFGLPAAKRAMQEKKQVIVLEGYMDVLASHQAGVANVVAPCGTALTLEQAKLLLRYAADFLFCFDSDDAGQTAEERAADTCWELGARLFTLSPLPQSAKDVDELVRKDPALWKTHAQKPESFFGVYERRLAAGLTPGDIAAKQAGIHRLIERLRHCQSAVEQEYWRSIIAQHWNVSEQALAELLKRSARSVAPVPASAAGLRGPEARVPDVRTRIAERIVALLLRDPDGVRGAFTALDVRWIPVGLQAIFEASRSGATADPVNADERSRIEFLGESIYHDLDADGMRTEAQDLFRRCKELYLRAELERISALLRSPSHTSRDQDSTNIFEQFRLITNQLAELSA